MIDFIFCGDTSYLRHTEKTIREQERRVCVGLNALQNNECGLLQLDEEQNHYHIVLERMSEKVLGQILKKRDGYSDYTIFVAQDPAKAIQKKIADAGCGYIELPKPRRQDIVRLFQEETSLTVGQINRVLSRCGYDSGDAGYGELVQLTKVLSFVGAQEPEWMLDELVPEKLQCKLYKFAEYVAKKDKENVSKSLEAILDDNFDAMQVFGILTWIYRVSFKKSYIEKIGLKNQKDVLNIKYCPVIVPLDVALNNLVRVHRAKMSVMGGVNGKDAFIALVSELLR